MKYALQAVTILFLIVGGIATVRWSRENRRLADEIRQLEAELGRMTIDDPSRVYIVEVENPDVPPEVTSHVFGVWQFRCYLPKGYSAWNYTGAGRVAKQGVYHKGDASGSLSSAKAEPIHTLLTLSLVKRGDELKLYQSFNGVRSGTTVWRDIQPDRFDDSWVVEQLVRHEDGPRSFDQDTILPLLKIYDPASAQEKQVDGKPLTTYMGLMYVWCPKSRKQEFEQLRIGRTPKGFDSSWIATEASDE